MTSKMKSPLWILLGPSIVHSFVNCVIATGATKANKSGFLPLGRAESSWRDAEVNHITVKTDVWCAKRKPSVPWNKNGSVLTPVLGWGAVLGKVWGWQHDGIASDRWPNTAFMPFHQHIPSFHSIHGWNMDSKIADFLMVDTNSHSPQLELTLSSYYMLDTVLNTLPELTNLILLTLRSRCYYPILQMRKLRHMTNC